jgi:hypothetical protein
MEVRMLLALVLAAAVAGSGGFDAQAAIKPVTDIVASVRTYQARQPPPKDDAERLVRLGQLDQAIRSGSVMIPWVKYSAEERAAISKAMGEVGRPIDKANQAALLEMLPPEGWFLKSRYGEQAAKAAFLIVQHSEMALLPRFVPVLEPLAARGEVDPKSFAMMYDRLAANEHRPLRYGTQFKCEGGRFIELALEDPANLDVRRAAVGLNHYAEQAKGYVDRPC